jgi:hypothetical protein
MVPAAVQDDGEQCQEHDHEDAKRTQPDGRSKNLSLTFRARRTLLVLLHARSGSKTRGWGRV